MSEKQEKAHKEARAALRKILASKGKLQGNFYYVGDTKGSKAVLVVTLVARDAKGGKAAAAGKDLRKEMKGCKYVRGLVVANGSKLTFTPTSGTGTKEHMKLGFKKTLCNADGMNFIRKAAFAEKETTSSAPPQTTSPLAPTTAPSSTATTTTGDDDAGESIDLAELFDTDLTPQQRLAEQAAAQALVRDQNKLGDLNVLLADFLNDNDELTDEERTEQTSDTMGRIETLRSDPDKQEELQQERERLATLQSTGTEPFPTVGGTVSPVIQEVMTQSTDKTRENVARLLNGAMQRIKEIHTQVQSQTAPQRASTAPQVIQEVKQLQSTVKSYQQQLQRTAPPTTTSTTSAPTTPPTQTPPRQ